ncbi:MAG TPA: SDR family oxidoreductase [Acidimicrobiales bacterium]|nr:SDR family oxidoreductase [Acidimicrobiales bacterium]
MDIEGRVVVVTGAASGIGRALCEAFGRAGARGVVAGDVNGEGAVRTASGLPDGLGVRCDVAVETDVVDLVRAAEESYGRVDIFCANAGIFELGGTEVPDAAWQRIWEVNVMSHVYAARAVLPSMLERREGYLVHTASAAGLLTQLGSAPYAVTKHAVVALAEWLSITHGDAGIRVSCLCPQGVWTAMTGATDPESREMTASTAGRDGMLEPEQVAEDVLAAVREERFLVLPHPVVATYEQRRAGDRERWLRGMRRLQASLASPPYGRPSTPGPGGTEVGS